MNVSNMGIGKLNFTTRFDGFSFRAKKWDSSFHGFEYGKIVPGFGIESKIVGIFILLLGHWQWP